MNAVARDQRGSMAVEFAMVFPLFFLILYAIVTYSLIFVAKQSLTLAAEEGARAALNYQMAANPAAALTARSQNACVVANNMAGWLAGKTSCATQSLACNYDATMNCVQVTLTYSYTSHPLVPVLPLTGLALPSVLTSTATVQLNPGNLL
jgi:Flp pilus assembly protein TadG